MPQHEACASMGERRLSGWEMEGGREEESLFS